MGRRKFLVLASATGLAACAPGTTTPGGSPTVASPGGRAAKPRTGGTLRYSNKTPKTAAALNMLTAGDISQADQAGAQYNVYETLYRQTKASGLKDWLAEKTTISSDGLTWTLNLKSGVRFHDGTEFDAAAVKTNIDVRKAHPTFPLKGQLKPIKEVRVVDKSTVQFILSAPSASLKVVLAAPTFGIQSPAALAKYPEAEYFKHAAGTGPFRIVDGAPTLESLDIVRNEEYWGEKAYLDKVEYRAITDSAVRLAALEAGDLDLVESIPEADLARIKSEGKLQVEPLGARVHYFWFNCSKPPFNDARVRRAVIYGTNRDSYRDVFGRDLAEVSKTLMQPAFYGVIEQTPYPYDVAKAKQLLSEAGIKPGTKVEFHFSDALATQVPVAQLIERDLEQLGFDVNLVVTDNTAWIAKLNVPAAETIWNMSWITSSFPYADAEIFFFRWIYGPNVPPNGTNFLQYQNKELDALLEKQQRATNEQERLKLLADLQRLGWDEAPMGPGVTASTVTAMGPKVRDLDYVASAGTLAPVFHRMWLAE